MIEIHHSDGWTFSVEPLKLIRKYLTRNAGKFGKK